MSAYRVFVERLAADPAGPTLFNLYAGDDPAAATRRENLALYLRLMAARRPRLLLVGEAPGHRGCRQTGVPFTSAAILLSDPSPFGLFGAAAGFHGPAGAGSPRREATATAMWSTLAELDVLPLLWNALPFHPHRPGQPASNRPPTTADLARGQVALQELLGLFEIERVVAVGSKAAGALARWGVDAARVRHPGHGGGSVFRRELAAVLR
jgi:uracil-DNA glycosylase